MNPKTIFEELEREGEEDSCQKADIIAWLSYDPSWFGTGWLLERLPEWEDLGSFILWYCKKYVGAKLYDYQWQILQDNIERCTTKDLGSVSIPLELITSPSILPEKIGEYIEQRGEGG